MACALYPTLFLSLLLFLSSTHALDQTGDFQPYMIDHEHPGCPANAHCHATYGNKRQPFTDLLVSLRGQSAGSIINRLESHRREHGIPFPLWATPESLKNKNISSWHSSCPHHNREIQQYYFGEVIIKTLLDIPDRPGQIQPHRTWMLDGDVVRTYIIPQGAVPGLVVNDELYFTREEQGIYYGLMVGRGGELRIVDTRSTPVQPREVRCPQELTSAHESWVEAQHIFQRFYCRAVWDETRQTYQTFLVGWAC